MGYVTRTELVCDRCGESVPSDSSPVLSFELPSRHPGWRMVGSDRALCPACAPGYDLLMARHRVEEEDYITGAAR